MEAQMSYLNDMSKSLFRTVQLYSDLNIQLAQTLIEESAVTGHDLLTAERPTEAINVTLSHAQPAADKLRAYQQHLSRIAASTQVDLAKVAEEHVTETSRTAKALAEEVARLASEETEKNMRSQQDAVRRMADTFNQFAEGRRGNGSGNGHDRQQEESRVVGSPVQQATAQEGGGKQQGSRKDA
ncbi:MAG: TIGR01841 family phasin [Pseudomonadota bacterium]